MTGVMNWPPGSPEKQGLFYPRTPTPAWASSSPPSAISPLPGLRQFNLTHNKGLAMLDNRQVTLGNNNDVSVYDHRKPQWTSIWIFDCAEPLAER